MLPTFHVAPQEALSLLRRYGFGGEMAWWLRQGYGGYGEKSWKKQGKWSNIIIIVYKEDHVVKIEMFEMVMLFCDV